MTHLIAWMILSPAFGQDLVPVFPKDSSKSWMLEAYVMDPGVLETPNHKQSAGELFAAHVTCKPIAKRAESCTFEGDKMYWGWLPQDGSPLDVHEIKAPITVDIFYTPTGRISTFDPGGDRATFQQELSEAYKARVNAESMRFDAPDFRRRLGQELEARALQLLIASLDIELPKKGDDRGMAWRSSQLPYIARRGQGAMGGSKMEFVVSSRDDLGATVSQSGESVMTVLPAPDLTLPVVTGGEQTFNNKIEGKTLIGKEDGRPVAAEIWTSCYSVLPIIGYKTIMARATKWTDDLTLPPTFIPAPPGRDQK